MIIKFLMTLLFSYSVMAAPAPLKGHAIPVFISEGIPTVTAERLASRGHSAYQFLSRTLHLEPKLSLYILSQNDWANFSDQVFGMPSFDENTKRLIVAGESSTFWEGFVELFRHQATAEDLVLLETVYGKPINLSSFFDLLVIHELGHAFHIEAGKKEFPRTWLQEFYANLALELYVAKHEPAQVQTLLTFPTLMSALPNNIFTHTKLSEFDFPGSNGITPENYVWYQANMHLGAHQVLSAGESKCLRELITTTFPGEVTSDQDLSDFFKSEGLCSSIANWIDQWDR